MPRWHYFGDINLEYGGFFYRTDQWQHLYADVVLVTPCSDAGLPDNQFWIENLVVEPKAQEDLQDALEMGGLWPLDGKTDEEITHMSIQACVQSGMTYKEAGRVIQIGGPDPSTTAATNPWSPTSS